MKAFFTKAACVPSLLFGLAVMLPEARADVYGWNDLKDAINSGQSIVLADDVESAENLPVWTTAGSENVSGSGHRFIGSGYSGFVIQDGQLYFSDVEAEGFNRFLSNLSTNINPDSDPDEPEMYTINVVDSVFRENALTSDAGNGGGAVYNSGTMNIRNSQFFSNSAEGSNGGAVANTQTMDISDSVFKNNSADKGGAIYNTGTLTITGGEFADNLGTTGGAIYSSGDLLLNSGGGLTFSGNGNGTNDIYMEHADLTVKVSGGDVTFGSGISGSGYNLVINGNDANSVVIKGSGISGAESVTLNGGIIDVFGGIDPMGNRSGGIKTNNLVFSSDPSIILNVKIADELTGAPNSPVINVSGDVSGSANLIIKPDTDGVLSPDTSIVFLEAPNDDLATETSFKVSRVYLSPYLWDTKVEYGDGSGSTWYIYMTEELNTGGDGSRILTPEIVAYIGAQGVVLEQHRNMVTSVRDKVASNKFPAQGKYGMREDHFYNQTGINMWVNPVYSYASLSAPVDWDADITGGDFGFDIQGDLYNKLGIFGSYRYGEYEFSGDGEAFASPLGSDIKDSSFMAGLYYRYDKNNFWSFATLYGGKHNLDISVEDGAVSETTAARQFGGSLEVGHSYVPWHNLTLEPSLGVFYTMVDTDDITDSLGKSAEYDMLHQIEGELSLKLEKTYDYGYGYGKIYLKPSVIQTFVTGNSVAVNGLNDVDTYDNQTLGRIELGGRYAVDGHLSLYGYLNYTAGSDYDNASVGAGFNYRFQ